MIHLYHGTWEVLATPDGRLQIGDRTHRYLFWEAAWAPLTIEPAPDTVIRLFLVLSGHDQPVVAGNPALPRYERHGFTVFEWGGCHGGRLQSNHAGELAQAKEPTITNA